MPKARNIMYEQKLDHLPFENFNMLLKAIESLTPKRWAYIYHDRDTHEDGSKVDKHVHFVLEFQNARSINAIAKILNEKPQQIEKWDGSVTNAYSYLLHRTTNATHKFQYEIKDVHANFDFAALIEKSEKKLSNRKNNDQKIINELLDKFDLGLISESELANQLTGSQYSKAMHRIKAVNFKRQQRNAAKWRAEMIKNNQSIRIIWIFGNSGTGKTRLARDLGAKFAGDYFISGSSRDPFESYNSERFIILDELRPRVFSYSDLLKMFDPFNLEASAASRYYDKILSADTIVITSPFDPINFYKGLIKPYSLDPDVDTLEQLLRRISLLINVTNEHFDYYYLDASSSKLKVRYLKAGKRYILPSFDTTYKKLKSRKNFYKIDNNKISKERKAVATKLFQKLQQQVKDHEEK